MRTWKAILMTLVGAVIVFFFVIGIGLLLLLAESNPDRAIALGQLFLEALVLPAAIVGFALAIREIRKSQERPELDVVWRDTGSSLTKTIERTEIQLPPRNDGEDLDHGEIAIINRGTAIGIWYLIHLEIPSDMLLHEEVETPDGDTVWSLRDDTWRPIAGDREANWKEDRGLKFLELEYMSNGSLAVYPGHTLTMCEIWFRTIVVGESPTIHKIPYMIFTDKGEVASGDLKIAMHSAF